MTKICQLKVTKITSSKKANKKNKKKTVNKIKYNKITGPKRF